MSKLTRRIQKEPPRKPVYSYQLTNIGNVAKTFPRVNQGQDKSQFKCIYSIEIHKKINEK